ncbi:17811_t:CDS:1, partial [Gigaspora margarita]
KMPGGPEDLIPNIMQASRTPSFPNYAPTDPVGGAIAIASFVGHVFIFIVAACKEKEKRN